jgi:hypothetical protein
MYTLGIIAITDEYESIKPIFLDAVTTFRLED